MALDLFSLKGRVALVTGGSRGIGKMIAKGFIDQGAKVYISSRKAPACIETAEELGPNCIALPQDVSTVEGVKALAAAYLAKESKLDILVNNAGAAWGAPFDEFPESGWDKVLNLNLKSPFFLTQALHGALKAAASRDQPAKVINIASIDGIRLNPQETYQLPRLQVGPDLPDPPDGREADRGLHQRHRHRARRLRLGDEPGGPRPRRRDRQAHPVAPHRPRRGHGRAPPSTWPAAPATMWWARPSPSTAAWRWRAWAGSKRWLEASRRQSAAPSGWR